MDTTDIVMSIICLLLGSFSLYLSIKGFIKLAKSKSFISCTGIVTDIKVTSTVNKGQRHINYAPVVSYMADGEHYEETYDQSSGKCKYNKGDEIEIAYNPNKHTDFIIVGDNSIIWNSLLMIAIACLMFFVIGKNLLAG